jgi:glycosyltransferase involved in cell wall biosynthesis
MRILQVSSASTWGGGESHVVELAESLRKRGHEVVIAGRAGSPLKPQLELPFLNSIDFITAMRLRSRFEKDAFDIVHAHVARDYTIVTAAAWGIPQPKIVFTRHLLLPVRPHFFYRRVDAWIAPTSRILKTLQPLAPKIAVAIPNWVDVEKLAHRPHALHTPITIGLLGQISPHKGHDDAVGAIRQLDGNFRLLIGGKGEASYENALRKRSAGLPVEFLGFVSLTEFLEKTDILIVPSWEEPFGIVLLEAMAVGIPVIATNRGGPLDIISSADEGALVPPRDPRALANAIQSLAADDERRTAIIRNARQRVEKHFDIRTIVPRIEDVYRRLIGSPQRNSGTVSNF